jgi:murein L,D-transpeptidase YcbB/YkuD
VLWLNEALAALNELPVQFTPASGAPTAVSAQNVALSTTHQDLSPSLDGIHRSANPAPVFVNRQFSKPSISTILANQLAAGSLDLIPGHWTWVEWYPQSLVQHWNPSTFTVVTEGAIMRFQEQHGLPVDGIAGPQVYRVLRTVPHKVSAVSNSRPPQQRKYIST